MALDTYVNLKMEIAGWLDRDDLSDYIDTFIDLAEARHAREIRVREMLTRETLAISTDDRYVALPADFLDLKYLRVQTPATTVGRRYFPDLDQCTIDRLTQMSVNEANRPSAYSVHEEIEFNCPADQDYTGEIFYYVQFDALSDSVASNDLLTKAPDAYLYGALAASAPFLMNDERVQLWESLYASARDGLNSAAIQNRHGGPLVAKLPPGIARVPR